MSFTKFFKTNKFIALMIMVIFCLTACGGSQNEAKVTHTSQVADKTQSTEKAENTEKTEVVSNSADTVVDTVESKDKTEVKVLSIKGPTSLGLVKFMADVRDGNITSHPYDMSIVANMDEVPSKVVSGEVDIALVPANLAAVLYQKTQHNIEVLAINTLGVLSIVEMGDSIKTVGDLKGRTIYASGKGRTPEYVLNYILKQNGLDPERDVTIEWKNEHQENIIALANDPSGISMLPQPFVTAAMTKNENLRIALDLTEEWDKLAGETKSTLVTGVAIARKDFINARPDVIEDFMMNYEESIAFAKENVNEAAKLSGEFDIIPEPIAKKALPNTNIAFIDGEELKDKLSGYLKVLYDANPKSVGGALPSDDFYYNPKK